MDERKAATLEKIFGKELAAGVIANAESKTKELEANTKFKEVTPVTITLPELTGGTIEEMEAAAIKAVKDAFEKAKMTPAQMAAAEDATDKGADDSSENPDGSQKKPAKKEFDEEQMTQLATLITDLSTQVEELTGLSETVKQLQTQVKELSKSDEAKIGDIIAPRWQLPNGTRPTESNGNVITDPNAIKELQNPDDGYKDPAYDYVQDLIKNPAAVASN